MAKDLPADCRVRRHPVRHDRTAELLFAAPTPAGPEPDHGEGQSGPGGAAGDLPLGRSGRQGAANETVVEKTPYTYEIVSSGRKWEDCVCKTITVEALAALGKGNRTEVKEAPADFAGLPPLRPAEDTRESMAIRQDRGKLPPAEELVKDLEVPEKARAALYGLIDLREPSAFEAIRKLVYEVQPPAEWMNPLTGVKEISLAALYATDPAKARPVLLDVLREPSHSKWRPPSRRDLPGNYLSGVAIIGSIAADAGWKEFVPVLVKAMESPCREDIVAGLLRVGPAGRPAGRRDREAFLRRPRRSGPGLRRCVGRRADWRPRCHSPVAQAPEGRLRTGHAETPPWRWECLGTGPAPGPCGTGWRTPRTRTFAARPPRLWARWVTRRPFLRWGRHWRSSHSRVSGRR